MKPRDFAEQAILSLIIVSVGTQDAF